MAFVTENNNSLSVVCEATLLEDDLETASSWASKYVVPNRAYKWVVGRYAEADQANSNKQLFDLEGLRGAVPTIRYSPMNVDHKHHMNVGTWVAGELLYPKDSSQVVNPYVEVVGPFWRSKFKDVLKDVEAAFHSGALALSMEASGESVTCSGDDSCGETFPFKGTTDESYCDHINNFASDRLLNKPRFVGGALIIPPNRPGWKQADVTEIARRNSDVENEAIVEDIETTFPRMDLSETKKLMFGIQLKHLSQLSG